MYSDYDVPPRYENDVEGSDSPDWCDNINRNGVPCGLSGRCPECDPPDPMDRKYGLDD